MAYIDPDMDFPAYLADPSEQPSLTASVARDLLATAPKKVWLETQRLNPDYVRKDADKFNIGTAAHALFVGGGEPLVIIDADDYRTKLTREAKASAQLDGKTPILAHQYECTLEMAAAATVQFQQNEEIAAALIAPETLCEASVFWDEAGISCRCRPDFYCAIEGARPIVVHYKTTGIGQTPWTLSRYAASLGWEITAAHYHAGIKALTGRVPAQYFAVQEQAPPYLCLTAKLDTGFVQVGEMRRKRAIQIWARCLRENDWPGNITTTVTVDCPPWHENQAIEQKDSERDAERAGTDLLDLAAQMGIEPRDISPQRNSS